MRDTMATRFNNKFVCIFIFLNKDKYNMCPLICYELLEEGMNNK